MTIAERIDFPAPAEQTPQDVDLEAQALALHGDVYERMRQIKAAAGELSMMIFVHGEDTPEADAALETFDRLVYPPGMNSKKAKETAPAFKLDVGESGELKATQVDSRTGLPPVD